MDMNDAIMATSIAAVGFAEGFIESAMRDLGLNFDEAVEMARAFLLCASADIDDYVENKKKSE